MQPVAMPRSYERFAEIDISPATVTVSWMTAKTDALDVQMLAELGARLRTEQRPKQNGKVPFDNEHCI